MLAAKLLATPILLATELIEAGELGHLGTALKMASELGCHLVHNCLLDNGLLDTWHRMLDYDPCGLWMELYLARCHHLNRLLLHGLALRCSLKRKVLLIGPLKQVSSQLTII